MSVVRIVTRIFPSSGSKRDDHLLQASEVGVPLGREWSHTGSAFVAETTFCKENVLPPGADIDAASACPDIQGLVGLKKSRLRLSSEDQPPEPPRRRSSLFRVCPEMAEDGTCGGILLSIPLRISMSDLVPSDQKKFLCEVCGKGFNFLASFSKHCERHQKPHPLQKFLKADDRCLLCDHTFPDPKAEVDIRSHLSMHLSSAQLEYLDELLLKHSKNAPPRTSRLKEYRCPCCEETVEGCVALKHHIKDRHPGVLPYECDKCPERFISLGLLRKHWAQHTDPQQFLCDVCGKGFSTPGGFAQHSLLHKGEGASFRCGTCGKVFHTKASFVIHKRSHNRKYSCTSCGMRFKFPMHLKNHVATFHHVATGIPDAEVQPTP